MDIGEVADRYTINKLKNERLGLTIDLSEYEEELERYEINEQVNRLYEINGKIWDLESDIRKGKEGELGLEEVGRRAIQIRIYNGERISVKNEIAEVLGGFIEVKGDHASV